MNKRLEEALHKRVYPNDQSIYEESLSLQGHEGNVSLKLLWDSNTLPLEWVKLKTKNTDNPELWLRTPQQFTFQYCWSRWKLV